MSCDSQCILLCQLDKKVTSSGRVNRANQRRLASVFSTGDVSSDLAKYNQLKVRPSVGVAYLMWSQSNVIIPSFRHGRNFSSLPSPPFTTGVSLP